MISALPVRVQQQVRAGYSCAYTRVLYRRSAVAASISTDKTHTVSVSRYYHIHIRYYHTHQCLRTARPSLRPGPYRLNILRTQPPPRPTGALRGSFDAERGPGPDLVSVLGKYKLYTYQYSVGHAQTLHLLQTCPRTLLGGLAGGLAAPSTYTSTC